MNWFAGFFFYFIFVFCSWTAVWFGILEIYCAEYIYGHCLIWLKLAINFNCIENIIICCTIKRMLTGWLLAEEWHSPWLQSHKNNFQEMFWIPDVKTHHLIFNCKKILVMFNERIWGLNYHKIHYSRISQCTIEKISNSP